VIVETARGEEFGVVSIANRMVPGTEVVLPLRRVVRLATPEDERRHEDNLEKETEAYNLCLSRIEAHRLDMKLVDVEYAFDNSKLLFYFTAEGRVDFRELVKDLASVFRTRIELRQIGIRDEAKLMGGLGVCGRPFCCKSFLPDFVQVSIKMAKEQNLSLNSAKISGACGRLMCCLRYEYETYLEESALTPKVDAIVDTPDGEGVVIESSPLKGTVKVVLNKEPNGSRLYRREDLTVTGSVKGKRKSTPPKTPETPKDTNKGSKKSEEKA
jgi:cell fate regulator YaaT (PSP1 superfamily)